MSKKELAISFLKMAGSGDVRAAYEKFIAPEFIHHNIYFKGDRQSLMLAMEEAHKASPNKSIDVKHAYEDGDTVITHSLVSRKDPSAAPIAVVHIFRFSRDQVVELWDLGMEVIRDSPNKNGAF
jgi:predicted SnoaL-like aldol condensation-catalyzing enzyme